MKNYILTGRLLLAMTTILGVSIANAQQQVIINKDNTRPETKEQLNTARFTSVQASSFTVTRHNGYNEIQWSALGSDASNQFILEYSYDGVNYLSGGPVVTANGHYSYKHYSLNTRPLLYRLRVDDGRSGKRPYSNTFLMDGEGTQPVQLYSTMIKGNMINATAQFPVEKVIITSADGSPVFSKDINGVRDHLPIAIPDMGKGIYFISFYGNGWISTTKFIVS